MQFSDIKNKAKVIGLKQVKKAVNKGLAEKVFIANDAEPHIKEPLKKLCEQKGAEFELVESMKALGQACGIDVGAATVAIVKEMKVCGKEV